MSLMDRLKVGVKLKKVNWLKFKAYIIPLCILYGGNNSYYRRPKPLQLRNLTDLNLVLKKT